LKKIIIIVLFIGIASAAIGGSINGAFLGAADAGSQNSPEDRTSGASLAYQSVGNVRNTVQYNAADSGKENKTVEKNNTAGNGSVSASAGSLRIAAADGGSSGVSIASNNNAAANPDPPPIDLQIMDQDELYRNGVTATWVAVDMKPGSSYDFFENFVQMRETVISITLPPNHTEISVNYSVTEEIPCVESDTDCFTDQHPDEMAKHMLFTRCVYKGDSFCIDCLTGKKHSGYNSASHICSGSVLETRADWKINDTDADGKTSFYDMKSRKLDNLPPVTMLMTPRFEIGIKFSELAGNDFQGDIFKFIMMFTLNQDASQ
jgi:hypothetical protein